MQRGREAEAQADGGGVKRLSLAAVERKQSRHEHINQPLSSSPSSSSPSSSAPSTVLSPKPSQVEAVASEQQKAKTSEEVQLTTATVSAHDSGVDGEEQGQKKRKEKGSLGKRKRSRKKRGVSRTGRWRRRRKERDKALAEAAAAVLNAVQHDTSQLLVVSGSVDGHRCSDILIDPGASSNFVRMDWVKESGVRMEQLAVPLDVTLADGKVGARLTAAVSVRKMHVQDSVAPCTLTVMEEMSHAMILGLPWLRKAGVRLDFGERIHWNGKPMYRIGGQKGAGGAELHAITVASEHEQRMQSILADYPTAFSKELRERSAADIAGAYKCHVQLKDPNCRPVKCKERRRSPADEAALRAATEEMLAKGLIRKSMSEWVSQPVLVKKVRDGVVLSEKRPCWDYRFANDRIRGDAFPLPLPENMFDSLRGSRLFSKLDLTKGFWQIPLTEESRAILAMSTPLGLMEPLYMPFGMKNAPAVFQRAMQLVLGEYLGKGVLVFMDDILIYTATVEEHEKLVRWVLHRLVETEYYANPDKCEFFQKEVSFLGHVISEKGVAVQQHKVKAVREWPSPTTKKQVKAFLGLTGYYRKFIPSYSQVALPLTELTKESVVFAWGPREQRAFDALKQALTQADVLAHADPSRQYLLHTDASGFAIAGVLSQVQADGTTRPVAYYSKKMSEAEKNYRVHDQELLAIFMAMEHWRCYLEGNPYPVKVLSDHRGLTWLNTKAELTGREARWLEKLADFDFTVQYVEGSKNAAADALSRRADLEEPSDGQSTPRSVGAASAGGASQEKNEEATPPRPRLKIQLGAVPTVKAMETTVSMAKGLSFIDELKRAAAADPWYSQKLSEVTPTDGLLRDDGLLVTFDGRFYVPADREMQRKLLYEVHDAPTGGHLGQRKTLHKLQSLCYWPGMQKDVEDYVQGCVVCGAVKPSQKMPAGLLQPLPIPHRPWEVISMDFVGPLARTKQYDNAVLSVVCKFSKQAHLIATTTEVTAVKTAKLLIDRVFKLHGLPTAIVSDRDPRFTAGVWKEVFAAWGTQLRMSSSYHPQTDGQTERMHRVMEAGLRAYADKVGADWADSLPMIEAFYNSSRHESTGKTPFEMNGVVWTDASTLALRSPMMDGIRAQAAEDLLKGVKTAWEDARLMLLSRRETMKKYADRGRRDEKYVQGDRVWLRTQHLAKHSTKLSDPYVGPFEVTRVSDNGVNVWLRLPRQYARLHQPFHVEKVKRYTPSVVEWGRQQEDRPLPEVIDEEEEYEVETLIGKREGEELVEVRPTESEEESDEEESKEEVDQPKEDGGAAPRRSARLAGRVDVQRPKAGKGGGQRKPRRVWQSVVRYLVKWKGYGVEEATWERADSLRLHAQDSIDEYERRQAEMRGEDTVTTWRQSPTERKTTTETGTGTETTTRCYLLYDTTETEDDTMIEE